MGGETLLGAGIWKGRDNLCLGIWRGDGNTGTCYGVPWAPNADFFIFFYWEVVWESVCSRRENLGEMLFVMGGEIWAGGFGQSRGGEYFFEEGGEDCARRRNLGRGDS